MLLSRLLANFTRGESDSLRKAMGKKLKDKLDELKPQFISGGQSNGHDPKVLEKIWADWEKFASYAFNKSHATCYSWIAYQTAYLKANFPSEYMAALLSRNLADIKTLSFYMNECTRMKIKVLVPDINESMERFAANDAGDIRFGLVAIKGVGEAAVRSIIDERQKNGRFTDIYDLFKRLNYSTVNRKSIENIALAGGLDEISQFHRCRFFEISTNNLTFIELLIRYGQRCQQEQQNAQQSLFGGEGGVVDIEKPTAPISEEWSQVETLKREREIIGLFLSAHPLDEYSIIIDNFCNAQVSELSMLESFRDKDVTVAGMVIDEQHMMSKGGKPFGKFTLEDYEGSHEFMLFGKDYENFRKYLYKDYFLFVKGRVEPRRYNENMLNFNIKSIMQLSEYRDKMIKSITFEVDINHINDQFIKYMEELTLHKRGTPKGSIAVKFRIYDSKSGVAIDMVSRDKTITLNKELIDKLNTDNIEYKIS